MMLWYQTDQYLEEGCDWFYYKIRYKYAPPYLEGRSTLDPEKAMNF